MEQAPYYADITDGPEDGAAWWVSARDGVRLRIGSWARQAPRGTILLLPGRTEFVEKYGLAAADFAARGYCTCAIDWRGQGLADRLADDEMAGHVHDFTDYQHDLRAMLAAASDLALPRPWFLLGHSMGGSIGLRAVMEDLPVRACAFTGPMWGIEIAGPLRPVAWTVSWGGRQLGIDHFYAPGTDAGSYVLSEPFETNNLTSDRAMHAHMVDQLRRHPELALGGPSLRWLHEALREARDLHRLPAPEVPCVTIVGEEEKIVDVRRIRERMAGWPGGHLEVIEGARHEVMMEGPAARAWVFKLICDLFDSAPPRPQEDVTDPGRPAGADAPNP
jgi:lysophospholipase